MLAFAHSIPWLLLSTTVLALGGLVRPTLTSMITQKTSREEQGTVLGLTQSLTSVSQIVGPPLGGIADSARSAHGLGTGGRGRGSAGLGDRIASGVWWRRMPDAPLCDALLEKIREQIERTSHLIGLVPEARRDWTPSPGAWTTRELIGHLLDCISGFCAVLAAAEPRAAGALCQAARNARDDRNLSRPH